MRYFLFVAFLFLKISSSISQNRYTVEESMVTFFSDGIVEDIVAENKTVTSIFEATKKDIAFLVRIKDFQFEKKLMQVHFNEKFLESEKYPKSTFVGSIAGFDGSKEGVQHVTATGKLFMHGVTRDIKIPGTIEKQGSKLILKSKFMIKLADYNISIPQVVWQNISEQVEVDLNFTYIPF
jgi:hypothetical protein